MNIYRITWSENYKCYIQASSPDEANCRFENEGIPEIINKEEAFIDIERTDIERVGASDIPEDLYFPTPPSHHLNDMIELARSLKSEHQENKEYDRALVDMVYIEGGGCDRWGYDEVAKLLGVEYVYETT